MTILQSNNMDRWLISTPFWVFISYPAAIMLVGVQNSIWVFAIYFMFLGETHFGATWLFFTHKNNWEWILRNIRIVLIIPLCIISIYVLIGLKSINAAVYLGSIASYYHVCRQSNGILRIFSKEKTNWDQTFIFLVSGIFLFTGYLRFFSPSFLPNVEGQTLILIIMNVLIISIALLRKAKNSKSAIEIMTLLTGLIMFSPYVFMSSTRDALAMGVGMHWCQYLAMNYKIYLLKSDVASRNLRYLRIILVLLYSFIMSYILIDSNQGLNSTNKIVLVPLALHMYHFYIDSFIWRFSDPEIRKNIGSKLFSKLN
jgi:hypothetical protein